MTTATDTLLVDTSTGWRRWISRHGWTWGVWILFLVLIAWYSTLIPTFGAFQVTSIVNNGSVKESERSRSRLSSPSCSGFALRPSISA